MVTHRQESGDNGSQRRLIDAGASLDLRSECDETALMNAARLGQLGAVRALIAAGADVNATRPDGATALFCATLAGQAEAVRALMDEGGAAVDTPLENGVTPLIAATFTQMEDCMRCILQRTAGVALVNRADKGGATPLTYAAMTGNAALADLLIAAGASLEHRMNGATPLVVAAEHGMASVVSVLLEAGADACSVNAEGRTAAECAHAKGFDCVVSMLAASSAQR